MRRCWRRSSRYAPASATVSVSPVKHSLNVAPRSLTALSPSSMTRSPNGGAAASRVSTCSTGEATRSSKRSWSRTMSRRSGPAPRSTASAAISSQAQRPSEWIVEGACGCARRVVHELLSQEEPPVRAKPQRRLDRTAVAARQRARVHAGQRGRHRRAPLDAFVRRAAAAAERGGNEGDEIGRDTRHGDKE